ncbi:hypothetical protein K432DRAFT_81629 [Lepidopterella palustris CBS 459.81]|uniref:Secreted protein n=1 Tax=Lepidopterella palustris CBS 459.81 TaxID=1314670 RepID=A0A8E2JJN1_9PEZI|nr:hypothetical protein K432DRAFT_81629 [Lepidopterella palustris CBS 459.81]
MCSPIHILCCILGIRAFLARKTSLSRAFHACVKFLLVYRSSSSFGGDELLICINLPLACNLTCSCCLSYFSLLYNSFGPNLAPITCQFGRLYRGVAINMSNKK